MFIQLCCIMMHHLKISFLLCNSRRGSLWPAGLIKGICLMALIGVDFRVDYKFDRLISIKWKLKKSDRNWKPLQVWNQLLLRSPCSPAGAAHGADVSWDIKQFESLIMSNIIIYKLVAVPPENIHIQQQSNFLLVYWSGFLLLWTILELSIESNMYFHKLSRQTPPHQVANGRWMTRNYRWSLYLSLDPCLDHQSQLIPTERRVQQCATWSLKQQSTN